MDSPALTWNGDPVACVPSSTRRGTVIIIGGVEAEIRLTLIARVALFTGTQPTAGKPVTYGGTVYRIAAVTKTLGGNYELDLMDANR